MCYNLQNIHNYFQNVILFHFYIDLKISQDQEVVLFKPGNQDVAACNIVKDKFCEWLCLIIRKLLVFCLKFGGGLYNIKDGQKLAMCKRHHTWPKSFIRMDISLLDFYEHIHKYEQIDLMSKFSPYSIELHFQDWRH